MGNENVGYMYIGKKLCAKEKRNYDICRKIDGTRIKHLEQDNQTQEDKHGIY